jgi:starch synthase
MKKERKILLAATECVPFAKTGGLADVVGALPKALQNLGAEVRVVLPKYGSIDEKKHGMKKTGEKMQIPMAGGMHDVAIWQGKFPDSKSKVYFVECEEYFGRDGLYQENGEDYPDNDERFALFSKAVIEMLKVIGYRPDVIHCNDWQTGLIPAYLKVLYSTDEFYRGISSVITIHNIAYQGIFNHGTMEKIGLPWDVFNMSGVEYWGHVSYLKAGLVYADVINTVSPTYAREIQASGEFGRGMEGLLKSRSSDLFGILNGIDYDLWDPASDKYLSSTFDGEDLRGKSRNKKTLQKDLGLPMENVPMVGLISRLADQKGFDLVADCIESMMEMEMQIVILGTGDQKYHEMLEGLAEQYGDKLSVNLKFDDPLAHKIYAGCDMFLMPSRFEPCGLGQMIALKYGTMPIVFHTGGLADTVADYMEDPNNGNGFVFREYSSAAMMDAVNRAMETYANKRKWNSIVKNCMKMDFSWKASASSYVDLYEKAMEKKAASVS